MNFEIVVIILLIIINGLFAGSEIAVVSSRKSRLQELAEGDHSGAKLALDLANEPTNFLSTIQIGITLVGTLAGAFGGATVARDLAVWLEAVPALAAHSNFISIGIVVVVIAYSMLIFGELVPKRVALNDPERIASVVASPLSLLSRVASPFVFILSASTEVAIRALGIKPNNGPPVTEEEIKILIDLGAGAGVFEEAEKEMVDRVFRLGDRKAATLMTSRSEIVWLDAGDTPDMIKEKISGRAYTLFPVCNGNLDNVMGVVHAKDLLFRTEGVDRVEFEGVLFPALFVPESMRGLKVLERFKETGIHLAIVVDEYGKVEGVVTLTDLLEAIVGDIPNIEELTEPPIILREDGSWLVDGMISIDDFKENFDIEKMPDEDAGVYQTLGGFAMTQFERIPHSGDHFDWGNLRFEVVDMDYNRVDKLLITPLRPDGEYGQ
jgi:putative hemolysin